METKSKHPHYYKDVSKLQIIDVYRVLQLFNVSDPCIQHAVKKLLVAGGRGAGKDITKDISEAIDSLERWEEMDRELNPKPVPAAPKSELQNLYEVTEKRYNAACDRLFDVLCGDDGQAFREAERFLEKNNPRMWSRLQDYRFNNKKG